MQFKLRDLQSVDGVGSLI